ncbi:unnamed protein product, partial [Staurois parvus]
MSVLPSLSCFPSGETAPPPPSSPLYPGLVVGAVALLLIFLVAGVIVNKKRRREHGHLWFPEGYTVKESNKTKKRREPLGEDSVGLKPLKNGADGSLMDDNQNE